MNDQTVFRRAGAGKSRPGRGHVILGVVLGVVLGVLAPLGAASAGGGRPHTTQTWGWGSNDIEKVGDNKFDFSLTPTRLRLPAGVNFTAVAAGTRHSLGLDSEGHVWAAGVNGRGQLGNGTSSPASTRTPVRVHLPASVRITAIFADAGNSMALDSAGQVWEWGFDILTPERVRLPAGVRFTSISHALLHNLALDPAGHVWAWGDNSEGQLGNGTTTARSAPARVRMPAGVRFTAVSAGFLHSLALDSAGRVWAWGDNSEGQLGNNGTKDRLTPIRIPLPAGVTFTAIDASVGHNLAIDSGGHVWAWGSNSAGKLGDGTVADRRAPIRVHLPAAIKFTTVAAGAAHNLALASTGKAWAWGFNRDGQLGNGTKPYGMLTNKGNPVRVRMPAGVRFTAIAAGAEQSLAISRSRR